jgi:CHASE3 domain sensor protein
MSEIPSEWTAEQWRDHLLTQPEHVAKEVIAHPRKSGPERLGAGMAQQVRDEARAVREEERHGEEMTAAAVANRIGLDALRRANLGLLLSGVAIVVAIATAIWQEYCK